MDSTRSADREAYIARTAELRIARGITQEEMARALGIPLERYKKYEKRSPLPPHLVERFALTVGRDIAYVITGHKAAGRRKSMG